jgi:hypothetical protein
MVAAQAAAQKVNAAEGYPKTGCETQAYCMAEEVLGVVFIMADAVTEQYLGAQEEVDFSIL